MNGYGESGGWHEAHAGPANAGLHEAVRRLALQPADDCSKSPILMAELRLNNRCSVNQCLLYNHVVFAFLLQQLITHRR